MRFETHCTGFGTIVQVGAGGAASPLTMKKHPPLRLTVSLPIYLLAAFLEGGAVANAADRLRACWGFSAGGKNEVS